ncbi:Isochorismatase hydrolase [Tilletiopsis washingtonensis]|jgi:nicotinamidase-related amidase|uniref:Isochorismatase hydrolase n=1 Tax=Tilletiopsis washingtonensis TaxID=58919 RepID=A0A316ZFK7_9BASI|nr:Isochorismatase hydrolase [Tilletiopsis washingtonensis]PWN99692.1 Isochorismatase hydrolase [Tilletiopsis washingtonensis]
MAATGASAARHLRRLDPSTTALFLCDMQERFVKAIHAFDAVHFSASKLLRASQLLAVPVYTTEQAPNSLGPTVPSLASLPRHPHSATVPKTRFSMVLPDTTEKWLAGGPNGEIKSVVLCGIEAHVCVLQTTLDLLEQGVGVWVVADGVSSCNAAEVPIALAVSTGRTGHAMHGLRQR